MTETEIKDDIGRIREAILQFEIRVGRPPKKIMVPDELFRMCHDEMIKQEPVNWDNPPEGVMLDNIPVTRHSGIYKDCINFHLG